MYTSAVRIGITSSLLGGQDPLEYAKLKPYCEAVRELGAQAVPLYNEPFRLEEQLAGLSGVILGGGADVGVEHYGGSVDAPDLSRPEPARDAFELALAHMARERKMPLLGICRGAQICNVAFGGTLIEDLPSEKGCKHRQSIPRTECEPGHLVSVMPESALAQRLGAHPSFLTNTLHHQAIRLAAADLHPVGFAQDGIVEALEARFEHPFFVLVQWHPEELRSSEVSQILFRSLLEAADAYRKGKLRQVV